MTTQQLMQKLEIAELDKMADDWVLDLEEVEHMEDYNPIEE